MNKHQNTRSLDLTVGRAKTYASTLTVKNPAANSYPDAVGISEERQGSISRQLDEMVKKYLSQSVWAHDVIQEIMDMTYTVEELTYAMILHLEFRRRQNWPTLCPRPSKGGHQ